MQMFHDYSRFFYTQKQITTALGNDKVKTTIAEVRYKSYEKKDISIQKGDSLYQDKSTDVYSNIRIIFTVL